MSMSFQVGLESIDGEVNRIISGKTSHVLWRHETYQLVEDKTQVVPSEGLWNRVQGPCDVTGCVHARSATDSLLFSHDLVKFILHIVVT